MGLDDRRQATGRDSGECPKTVTHGQFARRHQPTGYTCQADYHAAKGYTIGMKDKGGTKLV